MQIVGAHGKASDTEGMHAPLPSRTGLSQDQAQALLQAHGPNALDTEPRRSLATRLLDMVREPMFVLLVAAAALYIALGDRLEGLTLSLFVLAMLGLTFWQEGRAESALQALRQLTEPMARVLRDGQEQSIPAREVVPGDLLLIAAALAVLAALMHTPLSAVALGLTRLPASAWAMAALASVAGVGGVAMALRVRAAR